MAKKKQERCLWDMSGPEMAEALERMRREQIREQQKQQRKAEASSKASWLKRLFS